MPLAFFVAAARVRARWGREGKPRIQVILITVILIQVILIDVFGLKSTLFR